MTLYVRFGDLLVNPCFELESFPVQYCAIDVTNGRRHTVRRKAVYAADKSDLSFEEWERTIFLPRMFSPTPEMRAAREPAPPPPPDDDQTWKRETMMRESVESVTAPSFASSSFLQRLESFTKTTSTPPPTTPTTLPVTTIAPTTLPPTTSPTTPPPLPTTQMPPALWLLDAARRFTH